MLAICTCLSVGREYTLAFPQWVFTHIPVCILFPLCEPKTRSPSLPFTWIRRQLYPTTRFGLAGRGSYKQTLSGLWILLAVHPFPSGSCLLLAVFKLCLSASFSPGCPGSKPSMVWLSVHAVQDLPLCYCPHLYNINEGENHPFSRILQ